MLTVGIAGGTFEQMLVETFPHLSVLAVDLDPVVLQTVKECFALKVPFPLVSIELMIGIGSSPIGSGRWSEEDSFLSACLHGYYSDRCRLKRHQRWNQRSPC